MELAIRAGHHSLLAALTYMVGFTDLTDRTAKWNAFESIVSNITNLILSREWRKGEGVGVGWHGGHPTTYSQI